MDLPCSLCQFSGQFLQRAAEPIWASVSAAAMPNGTRSLPPSLVLSSEKGCSFGWVPSAVKWHRDLGGWSGCLCKPGPCFPPWLAMQGGTGGGWLSLQAVTRSAPLPPVVGLGHMASYGAVSSAWGAASAAVCFLWQRDATAGAVCFSPSPCSDLPWSVPRYKSRAITFLIVFSFILAPLCPSCSTAVGGSQAATANNWGVWCTLTVL